MVDRLPSLNMSSCCVCGSNIACRKDRCSLSEDAILTVSTIAPGRFAIPVDSQKRCVCKKCKLKIQRVQRLRKQTLELENSIVDNLPIACESSSQLSMPPTAPGHHSESFTLPHESQALPPDVHSLSPELPQVIEPDIPALEQSSSYMLTPRSRRIGSSRSGTQKQRQKTLHELKSHITTESTSPNVAVSCINKFTF